MVSECLTTYCDKATLSCVRTDESGATTLLVCCNAQNPDTLCNDPPCWFSGQACPHRASPRDSDGARRLNSPSDEQTDETDALVDEDPADTWFDQWNAYNFPLAKTDESSMSDYDRTAAYHGWHPDVYRRKLMFARLDPSRSAGQMLTAMEEDETAEIATVRAMLTKTNINGSRTIFQDARQEIAFESMEPAIANLMKVNAEQARIARVNWKMEYDRNNSQRITRISVMRDTICKALIRMISSSETMAFDTVSFKLQLGKTTNLSRIHP